MELLPGNRLWLVKLVDGRSRLRGVIFLEGPPSLADRVAEGRAPVALSSLAGGRAVGLRRGPDGRRNGRPYVDDVTAYAPYIPASRVGVRLGLLDAGGYFETFADAQQAHDIASNQGGDRNAT